MTIIDRSGQLAALIRVQLAAQRGAKDKEDLVHTDGLSTKERSKPYPLGAETTSRVGRNTSIDAWITARIAALSPDDPNRRRRAFRIFLESVLRHEFGSQLIGDGGFDQLVDLVLQQMESDQELRTAIAETSDALLMASSS